jgi:cyclophilin family peptidyl-prolyl cis-trans isomerase/HEAT repeat protein
MRNKLHSLGPVLTVPVFVILFVSCGSEVLPESGLLSQFSTPHGRWEIDSLVWAELLSAEDQRGATEQQLEPLLVGSRSSDPEIRRIAVRALGRLERPSLVTSIVPLLTDSVPSVRAEAINALGQAVFNGGAELIMAELLNRLSEEADPAVRGVLAQTLGRLPYEANEDVGAVEQALFESAQTAGPETMVGVARGLESLSRRSGAGGYQTARTLELLRELSSFESRDKTGLAAWVRRLAVAALVRTGRVGSQFLSDRLRDPDWGVRRLAAEAMLTLDTLSQRESLIASALADNSAVVRYSALRAYGRHLQTTSGCDVAFQAAGDTDSHVALLAIDLLGSGCAADENPADTLARIVEELSAVGRDSWHRPAHAIVALAKLVPDRAAALLPDFVEHDIWWVRMYAARAATEMEAVAQLEQPAFDGHDNVREAAISGLAQIVGHDADSSYIAQLGRPDYQLVITAARALEGSPNQRSAVPALLNALERITAERRETSRDPRRVLLMRLEELAGRQQGDYLASYLRDFDPTIAAAAARILTAWTGRAWSAMPQPLAPQPLPPYGELRELAETRAVVEMQGGASFELKLLPFEAPTNAARFARLARVGYFDGLTFHRVVPGFVIQGGSPGANEYAGDGPYTRDELILQSHLRGTVGLSTRGRDTGDGQIYVNLVDNPRLDHSYTIFAEVVSGMDVVDGILEGAVIERVTWR